MFEFFSNWFVPAFWSFGPVICSMVGWLIYEIRRGNREYRESQEAQNKALANIQIELSWLKDFRGDSREQFKSAWAKIDRHDDLLHDHEGRISSIEAAERDKGS